MSSQSLDSLRFKIKCYSLVQIGFSGFFWAWAIKNMRDKKIPFDLGSISLLFPMVAGVCGQLAINNLNINNANTKHQLAQMHYKLTFYGHWFVALNYALGAAIGAQRKKSGFTTYCIIFTAGWWYSKVKLCELAKQLVNFCNNQ